MKIISLSPSVTETLFAIGMGDQIIANTVYCDYPEKAKKIPKIGSWIRIDIKKIQALSPDVLFTSSIVQEKIFQDLKQVGLHVCHTDPRSLKGIYESIGLIGQAVHKQKSTEILLSSMKKQEVSLRKKYQSQNIKVYIEEWFNPPMIAGNWVPDIVQIAGYKYGIIQAGDLSRTIDLAEIQKYDPDIILSSYCGFGKNSNPQHVLNRDGWSQLRAIKNGQLYNLDETILNRPGPRILEAVEDIRQAISLNR